MIAIAKRLGILLDRAEYNLGLVATGAESFEKLPALNEAEAN